MKEVEIMRGLNHPNIIEYRGYFTDLDFGGLRPAEQQGDCDSCVTSPLVRIKEEKRWPGKCLHILLEFAGGGDL